MKSRITIAAALTLASSLTAFADVKVNDSLSVGGYAAGSYRNTKSDPGTAVDKFDLDAARRMLVDFGALDLWPALLAHHDKPAIHMVRGGKSDRWKPDEQARLQAAVDAGVVTDVVLPSAGHWVHTDDPEGLLAVIAPLCA